MFWILAGPLIAWALWLLIVGSAELWRERKRPWWREQRGGDFIQVGRKRLW